MNWDTFFSLWQLSGLCCFSLIMLCTIEQQCHKPRLSIYFKEEQGRTRKNNCFFFGSCGKAFPDFTLATPSSGCSLSQILPYGSPKWYTHETIISKLGKMIQPWFTGKVNPKSLPSFTLLHFAFLPCVFSIQVEGSSAAHSLFRVVCGQQQGRRRLWLKVCSWGGDNGTSEQALGWLWCTPWSKFACVTVVSAVSSALT